MKTSVLGRASLNNKVSLNAFDLSHRNLFTSSLGQVLPLNARITLPNERWKCSPSWFTRAQTLQSNSFGRFIENVQTFYVPLRALWSKAPYQMLNTLQLGADGQKNSRVAKSPITSLEASTKLPYIRFSDIYDILYFFELFYNKYFTFIKNNRSNDKVANHSWEFSWNPLGRDTFLRSISMARLLSYLGYGDFDKILDPKVRLTDNDVNVNWSTDLFEVHCKALYMSDSALSELSSYHALIKQNDFNVSVLRLLAYHKIYQDFYRNDAWMSYKSWLCNVDYLDPSNTYIFDARYLGFDLRNTINYLNGLLYNNDYSNIDTTLSMFDSILSNTNLKAAFADQHLFDTEISTLRLDINNGVLPSPQYGDGSSIQINNEVISKDGDIAQVELSENATSNNFLSVRPTDSFSFGNLSSLGNFDINALRKATQLQKYKEITLSHDSSYKEQILAHFGVSGNEDIYTSKFIGGTSCVMQVDTQINQNLADDNAVLGGIASAQGSYSCDYQTQDSYGIIMTLYRIIPILDYDDSAIDSEIVTVDSQDLPIPEFDNIGYESRRYLNVFGVNPNYIDVDKVSDTYGYATRWLDYKVGRDVYHGAFKYGLSDKVMATNTLLSQKAIDPINRLLFVTPTMADSVFFNNAHYTVNDDQFYTNTNLGITAVRPFSIHSLPFAN